MTDSVKFPGTDIEAPDRCWLGDISWDAENSPVIDWTDDWYAACAQIEYLRSDTATPNDVIEQMLDDAYEAGFYRAAYHNKCSSSAAKLDSINEIRGRYESSNSD